MKLELEISFDDGVFCVFEVFKKTVARGRFELADCTRQTTFCIVRIGDKVLQQDNFCI